MTSLVAHLRVLFIFFALWGKDLWNDEVLDGLLRWWLLRLLFGVLVLVDGSEELDLSAFLGASLGTGPTLKQMHTLARFLCSS